MFSKMLPYSFADMQPGTAIIGFNDSQKMLLCVFHYRGIISSLWPSIPFSAYTKAEEIFFSTKAEKQYILSLSQPDWV